MPLRPFAQAHADLVHIVPAYEIKGWVEAGEAVLVDVREAGEHAAEAIPGAVNLPLSGFDAARLPPVPEGKKLVFHCRSGVRCGTAAEQAILAGYRGDIYRMEGGIFGWKAAGGAIRG
jgi:Rhodanese-related sulfurtransferase